MDVILYVFLGALVLASSFAATLIYNHQHHSKKKPLPETVTITGPRKNAPPPKPQMTKVEQAAFDAGRQDVRDGWIDWTKYPTKTEKKAEAAKRALMAKTEEGRQKLEAQEQLRRFSRRYAGYGDTMYDSVSGMHSRDRATDKILGQVPLSTWPLEDLRQHIQDASLYAGLTDTDPTKLKARCLLTAALVTDRVDESYDPSTAGVTAKYAYHDDHRITARYIEGRAKGTEDIMDAITHARTRSREIGAASEAIAAANQRHAAALRALRETNQATASHDQHTDYDAQFQALENPKE